MGVGEVAALLARLLEETRSRPFSVASGDSLSALATCRPEALMGRVAETGSACTSCNMNRMTAKGQG